MTVHCQTNVADSGVLCYIVGIVGYSAIIVGIVGYSAIICLTVDRNVQRLSDSGP
jgi:hypothetical protein